MIYDKLSNIQRYRGLHPSLDIAKPMGGHLDGCRIGFDAGGSDRKVSAVIDGETVFSEEVVWFPKITADPDYHYEGIAMGTSEAVGYENEEGCITGWLNELAFVSVDANPDAMRDEWSGDIGCGVKYFCQDGVIKLAPRAGIELDESLSPAEKLKVVQKLMEEGDERAAKVYESIGIYLGHTLAYYYEKYGFRYVLLGRVMSGKGGDLLLATCQKVLNDEYPDAAAKFKLTLPDEKFRRVGQSMAAASLPS